MPFIASLNLLAENILTKPLLISALARNKLKANDFSHPQLPARIANYRPTSRLQQYR
jgi:hypothetical protein